MLFAGIQKFKTQKFHEVDKHCWTMKKQMWPSLCEDTLQWRHLIFIRHKCKSQNDNFLHIVHVNIVEVYVTVMSVPPRVQKLNECGLHIQDLLNQDSFIRRQ